MKACDADDELQVLLTEMFDGLPTTDQMQRLQERLRDDEHAQTLYLEFCELHAALAWENGQVIADISPVIERQPSSRREPNSRWLFGVLAAVAASILCLLGWWALTQRDVIPSGPALASIHSRIDAKLLTGDSAWSRNEICAGTYELQQGLVQLGFDSGVIVLIEAPAKFDAVSGEKLVLHSGRLSANVPPEGIGFTVETPEANVVDFGTEFSVEVGAGESEVHVFEGHVQVLPTHLDNSDGETIDLRTDQAIRIADTTRQASGIDLDKDRFIRSINEPQANYADAVKALSPVAYYRMPIKQQGLACAPPEYAGRVMIGPGRRPACAPGIAGSSLRIGGKSIGRGAVVENAPPVAQNATWMAWVYADSRPKDARLVTNMDRKNGCFDWRLDENSGRLMITVRDKSNQTIACSDADPIELNTWHHVAATLDGRSLRLYRNGRLIGSTPCQSLSDSGSAAMYFGANHRGKHLWEGRIDEFAIFDQALSAEQIQNLSTMK